MLKTEGIISQGAYNRNKKTVSKRAIAVLIEIRFSCTGFSVTEALRTVLPENQEISTAYQPIQMKIMKIVDHLL